jgi:ubiquinone/menaquinone biosynthesis C-methylase UbiE
MLQKISALYYRLPQKTQNLFSRQWYERISLLDRDGDMIFMNYGYAMHPPLALQPEDESNRYCIQLYHRVAGAVDLAGKDVLEIGCGRGGGASYVARYLSPQTMTGLDLAENAIRFCRRHYTTPGLSFIQGNAEALQFPTGTFDAVINVESSHCYNAFDRFIQGVQRVLKPGGHFLFVDHRDREGMQLLRSQLTSGGLTLVEEEDVSANVVRALELDNARKQALIQQKVPRFLQPLFNEFAAMQGTRSLFTTLKNGERVYVRFVLKN